MFARRNVASELLYRVSVLLFISSTGAQWIVPTWVEGPPSGSPANGKTNVSVNGAESQLTALEGIPANSTIAVLLFDPASNPALYSGCGSFFKLGVPSNGRADVISLRDLDFESGDPNKGQCNLIIEAPTGPQYRYLYITIVDINDNVPSFTKYPTESLYFNENEVGFLFDFDAVDRDAGDTASLVFTLTPLVGDISSFTLDRQTGVLNVTKKLDFEKGLYYLFNVVVTDKGGLSSPVQVSLYVNDAKDTPPLWNVEVPVITIDEQLAINTPVFTVSAQDGDVSINDEIIYSLIDPRGSFSINASSGEVRIDKDIDRDGDNFDPFFDLVITATCKNYPSFQSNSTSTVVIRDINDNEPTFDQDIYDFEDIDEGYVGRLSDMDILISDPDSKENGTYSVKIEGSTSVTISPETGRNSGIFSLRITSSDLLDYENSQKRNASFKVVATAQISGTRTESVVNIYSRDVNDNSPVFTKPAFQATIVENVEVGFLVATAVATDADASQDFGQPSIRYSFVESFEASRYLTIDPITGEIRTSQKIDRELSGASLKFTLQAIDKDGANDGRRAFANLTIGIQDVNDDPPVFASPTSVTFSVLESEMTRKEVTTISASDRDANPNLELSINWGNSKFYKNRAIIETVPEEWKKTFVLEPIIPSRKVPLSEDWESMLFERDIPSSRSGSVSGTVKVGDALLPPGNCGDCEATPLDRETFDSVELCLTVTDLSTDPAQSPEVTKDELFIVINILDVNDNDPVFESFEEFVVGETTETLEIVFGIVRATDADLGNAVVYSILSEGSCSNITINPQDGQLRTTDIIDRELTETIECVVTAADNGTPPRSSSTIITIDVVDINDNYPILTVTVNPIEIYECSSETTEGMIISKLQATDADIGVYGTVSYLLSEKNLEGLDEFAIDLVTGDMTVKICDLLDYDKKKSYSVTVVARDNYRPGINSGSLSTETQVNITLKDVNDNAPKLPSPGTGCYASPLESSKLGDIVKNITGTDNDSPGPNSQLTFTLHDQKRIGEQVETCNDLFRMETYDNSVGRLIVNVPDMLDCQGDYDVTVQACDAGDDIVGIQCSSNVTYRICVLDVNNNDPQFVFPDKEGSIVEVPEDSIVGEVLIYNRTTRLKFEATDKDDGTNGEILYSWSDNNNTIFSLNSITGEVTLATALKRDTQSYYNLVVVATDKGVPSNRSTQTNLRINVRLSDGSKRPPFFNPTTDLLSFSENAIELHPFQVSVDPDNATLYPGETPYDVCYYPICGNTEYFEVPDKTLNQLKTKKELDRENPPSTSYVIIFTSNDCNNKPTVQPCSEINTTPPQYLNVSIIITDVNDCFPEFSGSLSGGITEGDTPGKIVFPMTVTDQDENDAITCRIEEDFTVSDPTLENVINPPFDIDEAKQIKLRFNVQAAMKGYFALNVTCTDKENHAKRTAIKIYVVTKENKVDIVFDDPQAEIEEKRTEIERIFFETLGYLCNVGSVVPYGESTRVNGSSQYYSAVSHFINQTSNTPVLASEIITRKSNPAIENELISRCDDEDLVLISVGPLPTEQNTSEEIFRILFIIAMVFIIAMIVLVVVLFIRSSQLDRRVKALSSNEIGSQDSGINRVGDVVPTSNKHIVEGSNPLYSIEGSAFPHHDDNFDNISESSGDSILIGVENNPEFKGYKPNGKSNGIVLEASSLPFQNVSRRNPLLLDKSPLPEPNYPPPPPPPPPRTASAKRPAPPPPVPVLEDVHSDLDGSSDMDDLEDAMNSNFSFGTNVMTAI